MLLLTVEVAFLGRFRARLVRHVVVPVLASPSPARLDFPWSTEARIDAKVVQLCEHGQEQGLVLGGASFGLHTINKYSSTVLYIVRYLL